MTACAFHPLLAAIPACPASAPEPLRFGPYRVLERADGTPCRLGAGSMGVTYQAFDERLELEVALKVIAPARQGDPAVRELFLREARAAARVRHTNVASVLALDDTTDHPFYAMELLEGATLEEFLQTRGRLPLALALDFAAQIARGLEAIHRHGLVHRDLKPANLMLVRLEGEAEWQLKIIDFGIATTPGGSRRERGDFHGTATYASPEQCLGRNDLNTRVDVYALGCILWEMLTGRPPFAGGTQAEMMRNHISAAPDAAAVAQLPAWLRVLLQAMLAKDPAQRPAATDVARRLERGNDETTIQSISRQPSTLSPQSNLPRPLARFFLLFLLVLHALIAAGIVSYLRAAEDPGAPITALRSPAQ